MRVVTWNLFHGRAHPAAGRPLLVEFARTIASWEWDVALLQECPPWWPAALAHAAGAEHRAALTSRNALPALRAAIARRNPDLIASNGGGCNAILVRGGVADHRRALLCVLPERRVVHGVRLRSGGWVVNTHTTVDPKARTRADIAAAARHAAAWADGAPIVLGGDLNVRDPAVPGFEHAAASGLDHVLARGWTPVAGSVRSLDAGRLSDHRPVFVELSRRSALT
jgi:endonuclease/exonuclease/phosphatase family metal-dependent hydrolase